MDELDDNRLRELQPQQFAPLLASIQRHRNQLDGYEARVLAAADAAQTARSEGDVDLADTHRRHTGASGKNSRRALRRAKALAKHPEVANALGDGDITAEQAELLARAKVPDDTRDELLALSRRSCTDDTRVAVRDAEQAASDETPERKFRRQHRRREAATWTDNEGMWNLRARLDPEAGARVQANLDAEGRRLWQEDKTCRPNQRRTPAQREADALTNLACREARADSPPNHGNATPPMAAEPADHNDSHRTAPTPSRRDRAQPARIQVTVSLDALRHATDEHGATTAGIDLAAATVRRLACEAGILPTVMGASGEVLDLGRERRTVSAAQRRALATRDRGCVWPGCHAPPERCDAHHIRHWVDGGPTDLSNLALLCHRHHQLLHEGGMCLQRGADGSTMISTRNGHIVHRSTLHFPPDQGSESIPLASTGRGA